MAKRNSDGGGLSLRRKDAVKGGGTEGALATITEIGFIDEFTYGGTQRNNPAAALQVIFEIEGFKKPWEEHYSVGPSKKYEVIEDGDAIRPVSGNKTGLNESSPAFHFFSSIEDAAEKAGLDIDELLPELDNGANSVRPLQGRQVRLTNIKAKTVGGDEKEYRVIAEFVDAEQDEASARRSSSNGNGKTNSAGKRSSSDDIEAKTTEAIQSLIEEHTSVKVGDLPNLVFQANKKDPDAKAMMQLAFKTAWLGDEERPWSFDKKKGLVREA